VLVVDDSLAGHAPFCPLRGREAQGAPVD
jgi:hypothetical protein